MTDEHDATLATRLSHEVYAGDATSLPLEPIIAQAAQARYVLIGEASHGTSEFYRVRAELTQRLIAEHGFNVVAVEADWPDAYRVNRFVRGLGTEQSAIDALGDFEHFPDWLWRNQEVVGFLEWLRAHNLSIAEPLRTGFYGIDLYGLHRSIAEVLRYLERRDPELAELARSRYACFEAFSSNYGAATSCKGLAGCEHDVVLQLRDLQSRRSELLRRDGLAATDAFLCAEQNARAVRDAELYYRTLYQGGAAAWNLRDQHMANTLDALDRHISQHRRPAKIIVWAHNAHVGDARATEQHDHGELSLGQIMRERHLGECFSIGFTSFEGNVLATDSWDCLGKTMVMPPALPGSWEALFHAVDAPVFSLVPRLSSAQAALAEPRLQRAVGVIYRPESERRSHYFHTRLSRQFDALIHIDVTQAVTPLEQRAQVTLAPEPDAEPAETFPTGL